MTLTATETRVTAPVCANGAIRICTWPENSARLAEVRSDAHRLNSGLAEINQPAVRSFSESPLTEGALQFGAGPTATAEDILYSLAAGYVLHSDRCPHHPGAADPPATALIALLAGVPERSVAVRLEGNAVKSANLTLRRGRARHWLLARLCLATR